jgi:hypothetical protein
MDTPKGEARCKQCGKRLVGVADQAICGRCASEYPVEFSVLVKSQKGKRDTTKVREG